MSVPTDQTTRRLRSVDEEMTYVVLQGKEIIDTQGIHSGVLRRHGDVLDRHTAYHKSHERDLAMLQMEMRTNASRVEAKFSRIDDELVELQNDMAGIKTDVSEVKTDVSEVKTDVSQIKDTLAVILSRLPAAA